MSARAHRLAASLGAALAGALTVFAFAPFGVSWLPVATLAALAWLWQRCERPRDGAWLGFAFGCGLFVAGVSWVYIALETFGGMAMPLAALATLGFCAYLALFPALVGWSVVRFTGAGTLARAIGIAAAWTLGEWLRGFLLTGFPWLALGYAQSPGRPLAGFAPIGGVWLVTLALALCASLASWAADCLAERRRREGALCVAGIAVLILIGAALEQRTWTRPEGEPLAVSLVQGNVLQDLKFDPAFLPKTFDLYASLVAQSKGRLIVLPESAFPVFSVEVPSTLVTFLHETATSRGGDVLVGVFTMDPPAFAGGGPRYYNSVLSLGASDRQMYRKHHLVPFGETIPLEPLLGWLIRSVLAIPLDSQTPGPAHPPPLKVAGQAVALDICYEDLFGGQIAAQARAATLLVNVTNDAWYGRSIAAAQHNQIAAMRARETGRPMLRATNTGITAAIGADGIEIARLPWFTRGILEVVVAGHTGLTPYVRFGDAPVLILAVLLLGLATRRMKPPPTLAATTSPPLAVPHGG